MARDRADRLVRSYLLTLGGFLLAQGVASLLALAVWSGGADATHGVLNHDWLHCLIHIAWGALMLTAVSRRAGPRTLARLTLTFGVFYSALALAGVLIHHPLGLYLEAGENGFHAIVGLAGLTLGSLATRAGRAGKPGLGLGAAPRGVDA